jgi:hypothetical protein
MLEAHVLGVVCRECPTHVVGQKLTPYRVALVPNGEQGDDDVTEDRQVVLTELREAWWTALSRVSSRSSPRAVVNQTVMVGLVG